MNVNESMQDDLLPRDAPFPCVINPQTVVKPVVPEISLIFEKQLPESEIVAPSSADFENSEEKQHYSFLSEENVSCKVPFQQHLSLSQEKLQTRAKLRSTPTCLSLPFKSYSAFRKNTVAGEQAENVTNLFEKKQVRVRFETPLKICYNQNKHKELIFNSVEGHKETLEESIKANRNVLSSQIPKTREFSDNDNKITNDVIEKLSSKCAMNYPLNEKSDLSALIQNQGEQIHLLQQQVKCLHEEIVRMEEKRGQELKEVLEILKDLRRPVHFVDKCVQCECLESFQNGSSSALMLKSNVNRDVLNSKAVVSNIIESPYPKEVHTEQITPTSNYKDLEEITSLNNPNSDKSLAMYTLTLKYLPRDKISELLSQNVIGTDAPHGSNMSFASLRYLEKYGIGRVAQETDLKRVDNIQEWKNNKVLDVTAIKRKPKLL